MPCEKEIAYYNSILTIMGQEKKSFDSNVNWSVLVSAGVIVIVLQQDIGHMHAGWPLTCAIAFASTAVYSFFTRAARAWWNYHTYQRIRHLLQKKYSLRPEETAYQIDHKGDTDLTIKEDNKTKWQIFTRTEFPIMFTALITAYLFVASETPWATYKCDNGSTGEHSKLYYFIPALIALGMTLFIHRRVTPLKKKVTTNDKNKEGSGTGRH